MQFRILDLDKSGFLILLLLLLGLAVVAYLPGLGGPLLLDDLAQLGPLMEPGGQDPSMLYRNYLVSTSGPLGRPVSMASFILDATTHGPDTWWWKYDSLMYHLICGLLLIWLAAMLARIAVPLAEVSPWVVGLIAGGLWLLHPLHVSTVLYTVQRMTILSTLFVFAGLVSYTYGRTKQMDGRAAGWPPVLMSFAVFLPAAAFSKESGLLLVAYITLVELIVCRFRGDAVTQKRLRLLHYILIATYGVGLLLLLANFHYVLDGYAVRDFTLSERVLTQFRVLVTYLLQIVLPLPQLLGFFHDDLPVSTGLLEPTTTLPSIILVTGVMAAAVSLARRRPLLSFGVLFFFASQVLESTVFSLELMFEHRNYIGSSGILLGLVALGASATRIRRAMIVIAVIACVTFFGLTSQYAKFWSTPETMYRHMYVVHPESSRLNMLVANVNASAGQFDSARKALARVDSGPGRALHERYLDCLEFRRVTDADLRRIRATANGLVNAYVTSTAAILVGAAVEGRCAISAHVLLEVVDSLLGNPMRSAVDRQSLLYSKAELLESMGQVDRAVTTYLGAQEASGLSAVSLYRAADMLSRHGRLDEARTMLRDAALVEASARVVRTDLAELVYAGIADRYVARTKFDDALSTYDEARSALPGAAGIVLSRCELLVKLGRLAEAEQGLGELRQSGAADAPEYRQRFQRLEARLRRHVKHDPVVSGGDASRDMTIASQYSPGLAPIYLRHVR